MVVAKGTIKWKIEDDLGQEHTLLIPNSYYAPGAPGRLLSRQCWAQTSRDNTGTTKGTWQATYDDCMALHWNGNSSHRSVPLDTATNVAAIRSAPSNKAFLCFQALSEASSQFVADPVCFNVNVVSDEDELLANDDNQHENDTFDTYFRISARQRQTQLNDLL